MSDADLPKQCGDVDAMATKIADAFLALCK
jgi:hypothetical protein